MFPKEVAIIYILAASEHQNHSDENFDARDRAIAAAAGRPPVPRVPRAQAGTQLPGAASSRCSRRPKPRALDPGPLHTYTAAVVNFL